VCYCHKAIFRKKICSHYKKVKPDFRALIGFVSRQEAEEYLHKSENETFLVRFSDSELGGVTVAWITGTGKGKNKTIFIK
jgi:hypothetical protein